MQEGAPEGEGQGEPYAEEEGGDGGRPRHAVGTEAWRRDLSDVILPLPVYDSSDDEGNEAGKEPTKKPCPAVGTEEWRTDLSDVILPLPVYDSSDDEEPSVKPHPPTAQPAAREGPLPPWRAIPPRRVLEMMQTAEKHSHQLRGLHALPRPAPLPGVATLRRIDAETAAREMDQLVGVGTQQEGGAVGSTAPAVGEPVIIRGLTEGWRAQERWRSAEAFVRHYGDMPLKVHEMVSVSGMGKGTELWLPARDYIEYAERAVVDAPFYVFQKKFVDGEHDALFEDYVRPPLFADDLWDLTPELRAGFSQNRFFCLGGERTGSALHVDPHFTGAWNALLCGEKRWVLFPPDAPPDEIGVPAELRDRLRTPSAYWWHDWYPKLAADGFGARLGMREVVQRAGETIYVPAGWWHAVLNHGWTIAVTENQLPPQALARAWPELLADRPRAAALARALRARRPELLPAIGAVTGKEDIFGDDDADPACHTKKRDGAPQCAAYDADADFRMW